MRRHSSCLLSRDTMEKNAVPPPRRGCWQDVHAAIRRYSSIFGQPGVERNWLKFHRLFTRNLIRSTIEVITRIVYTRWIYRGLMFESIIGDVLEIVTGKLEFLRINWFRITVQNEWFWIVQIRNYFNHLCSNYILWEQLYQNGCLFYYINFIVCIISFCEKLYTDSTFSSRYLGNL